MNLKAQVIGINKFLADVYQIEDMRLSLLLAKLNFKNEEIKLINQKFLPNIVAIFLNVLETEVTSFQDGVRKFEIIKDIYGLNGSSSMKLREAGEVFNLSQERIRQIKNKVIRQLTDKSKIFSQESEFTKEVVQLLESNKHCAINDSSNYAFSTKFNFYLSSPATGEESLTITAGDNKIIIAESDFQEFYDDFSHHIKLLKWSSCQVSKIENIKKMYSRAYESWTKEEEKWLKIYLADGLNIKEIAEVLARQPSAISSRMKKLGLRPY